MSRLNGFFAFLVAPLVGIILAFHLSLPAEALTLPLADIQAGAEAVHAGVEALQGKMGFLNTILEEQERQYQEQLEQLLALAEKSEEQAGLSDEVYDARILAKLGPPIGSHNSRNVDIQVFELKEIGYRGYIAKIKLFNPASLRVLLGQDKLGSTETTSSAVARSGAILGINGGGFYRSSQGGRQVMLPLGNTVINNKLQQPFSASDPDLFFAGVDMRGNLIGGHFATEAELMQLKPWQGVSFLPILLQGRKPMPIPAEWQKQRHPRTIMGTYGNGDLVLIVVDGRQTGWSQGVTLEEMQVKLLDLGVIDAYNLDGGGSSAFVFDGRVLNRPSDGSERPVVNNIVIMP
jgi:exopolysaccharide biosynthesis protein